VQVRGLSTWWGPLSYAAYRQEHAVTVTIDGGVLLRAVPASIRFQR